MYGPAMQGLDTGGGSAILGTAYHRLGEVALRSGQGGSLEQPHDRMSF
jgi:hypothetical protein